MNERIPSATSSDMPQKEAIAAVDEVNVYSILMRAMPMILEHKERWENAEPKEVIDEIISRIPDTSPIVTRTEAQAALTRQDQSGPVVSELEAYFLSKILFKDNTTFHLDGVDEPTGISDNFAPAESIRCLRDGIRTKKFLRAIAEAVGNVEAGKDTVSVCDAGSGAIPILGMYAALCSPKVKSVCLENNPHSVRFARTAIEALGLSDRVEVVGGNATAYTPEQPIDLLISETMDAALVTEPLHDVLNHLQPYTAENSVTLPSRVETLAASVPVRDLAHAERFAHVADIYMPYVEPDWKISAEYVPGKRIPELQALVPGSAAGEERAVLLCSRVYLGSETLDVYDAIISTPLSVSDEESGARRHFKSTKGNSLLVRYEPGASMRNVRVNEVRER